MAQVPPPRRPTRHDRAWWAWLAAGTFVLGLVAGGLAVGLLGEAPPAEPAAVAPTGPAPGPRDGIPEPAGSDAVLVNAACLRAMNTAQDIAVAVEDLGTAAARLDPAQLDEVIRRLQPLQDRLRENSAACETSTPTEEAGSGPGGATPAPSPSSTASPTD